MKVWKHFSNRVLKLTMISYTVKQKSNKWPNNRSHTDKEKIRAISNIISHSEWKDMTSIFFWKRANRLYPLTRSARHSILWMPKRKSYSEKVLDRVKVGSYGHFFECCACVSRIQTWNIRTGNWVLSCFLFWKDGLVPS